MTKHNQDGTVSSTLLLGISLFLLVLSLIFGGWAYSSRQTYKTKSDQIVAAAVAVAKQQEGTTKDNQFAQASKSPLTTYNGPGAYGSLVIQYPKTWSGYVDSSGSSSSSGALMAAYFNPGVVPSVSDTASIFALQTQVLNQAYSDVLTTAASQSSNSTTPTTSVAYSLPKVPKVVGVEITGSLPNNETGTMVILPLRTQTLELWTEGNQYVSDFNNFILPNFSFSP